MKDLASRSPLNVRLHTPLVAAAIALGGCGQASPGYDDPRADSADVARVARGERVYAEHCASCHGAKLEGQPNWRSRQPNGRLPAPPHDETGHSWHHPDRVLFAITKNGLVPPYAPKGYESDMPAFAGTLSDAEIWAVLAYLKSHWTSPEVLEAREQMTRNAERP